MKKPSDLLFKLIKSLTKSEKRYFKSTALSHHESNKYLLIFEAIDAQLHYDEARLKQKFKAQPWIDRFNAAKNYLYNALLRSLAAYNQKHDPQFQLINLIIDLKILQQKGFYKQCHKLIEKGKTLAIGLDDHQKHLELLKLESLNHPGGVNPERAQAILEEQNLLMRLIKNECEFDYLYKQSFAIFSEQGYGGFAKKPSSNDHQALMQAPLLQDEANALTFNAKRQFINIHYFNAVGNRKANEMHHWIIKAIDLFNSNPKLIQQHAINYATTLLNLQSSHRKQGAYTAAFEALAELRSFYPRHLLKSQERLTYIIDYASLHHEIETLNHVQRFNVSVSKLPQLRRLAKIHQLEMSSGVLIRHHYLIASALFGAKNYRMAKRALNTIIESLDPTVRYDLHQYARLMRLMIYYELRQFDLLEYQLRSTDRFFRKKGKLNQIEKGILKLFRLAIDDFSNQAALNLNLDEVQLTLASETYPSDFAEVIQWFNQHRQSFKTD